MTFYISQVSHSSRVVACNVHLVPDGPCGAFYRDTTRLALLGRYMLMLSDKPTVITDHLFSAMIFVTGGTILKNGPDYVAQPHLVHIPQRPI